MQIKELPQDENKQGRPAEGREEIQVTFARILNAYILRRTCLNEFSTILIRCAGY